MAKITTEVIHRYLKKFPNTPTKTLANTVYKENKELFLSVEAVRSVIRYWRGARGKDARESVSVTDYIKKYSGKLNPFKNLPRGNQYNSCPEVRHLEGRRFLILCDLHVPYHNEKALSLALQYGVENNADHIVLNGDFCDFYSVSKWQKDPREVDFRAEIEMCKEILCAIRATFPKAKITFKVGNHEERLVRYLEVKAPELLSIEFLDIEHILELSKLDIDVVESLCHMRIGEYLTVIHGHEVKTGSSPVNPARSFYMAGKECVLGAHFHRTSQHGEKSIKDKLTQCWSVGCLCDMKPQYHSVNNWNHGFAFVTTDGKDFQVTNKIILNGKIQS